MAISAYQYPQVLHLTVGNILHNCQRTGANMITSQHYTNSLVKLFRNTDQTLDILLKDWDRRPVKLEEWEHVWFKLFDGTREIMEKEAELINFDRGHYQLEFTHSDTAALNLGDLTWCLVVKDTELGTTRMLWTDQTYGAHAPAKIIEGPLPRQPEAQEINPADLSMLSDWFTSSALVGAMQVTNPAGVHSLVFNLEDFTGLVRIEASLDPDIPAVDEDWVEVRSLEYILATGAEHVSIIGNYNWVRVKASTKIGLASISYRNA